jgi:hypothetical protein
MNARLALLAIAMPFCAAVCSAQPIAAPLASPPLTPRPINPAARSNMLARTGGIIQTPVSGPAVLFLNTQKRVPATALQETFGQIQKILRLSCVFNTAKASADPVADAAKALADKNTAAVIVICDSASHPALLVAPESRWVLVNVAALGGADVPADKLAERVQKEIWRAFGYVMGAANSNFEHCLLKPVFEPAELDALKIKTLSPEPFNKIMVQAQKLGMKPTRMTSYRKAVEEGWAPAPTNEIQRAIWEEVKKTPGK